MEEEKRAVGVDFDVFVQGREGDLGYGGCILANPCIGDQGIDVRDAVFGNQDINGDCGSGRAGAVEWDYDEIARRARREIGKSERCRVRDVSHCGNYGVIWSGQIGCCEAFPEPWR